MSKIRVMFVGQGVSGLPEDRFVNTFHFYTAGAFVPEHVVNACILVNSFYVGVGAGALLQTAPIGAYLSPFVSRTAELRAYNLEEAGAGPGTGNPRTPFTVPLSLPTAGSTSGLPEEVAVCLSFKGAPPNGPRRRGRIYIGPLVTAANEVATNAHCSRPNPNMILNLKLAAQTLMLGAVDSPFWAIRSTVPTENFVPVYAGYVDDAFDTQRRRGPDAASRLEWTTVP